MCRAICLEFPRVYSGSRQLLREALIWAVLIFVGVFAALNYDVVMDRIGGLAQAVQSARSPAPQEVARNGFERTVRLKADTQGHFSVAAHINDRPIMLMADTGATLVTLTHDDANRVGFSLRDSDFTHRTQTANGIARVAPVRLDRVRVGDIEVRDVRALVAEPGRLNVNLLGMSFMNALSRVEMRGGELVLVK